MKTLLIPVDFTATTDNAVNFGAEWCKQYEYTRVILLRSFYNNVFDHIVVSAESVNQDYMRQEREETTEKLEDLSRRISTLTGGKVTVITVVSEDPLLRAVMETTSEEKPDMILLGSDNYTDSENSQVASNVIAIAKISPVRVLIVPASYAYRPVQTALVAYDYKALEALDKLNNLRATPLWAGVKLMALNVDPQERYLYPDEKFREAENNLHIYLRNFEHEVHYSNDKNIINGIMDFTGNHDVQLIIAMPGRHSFLYALTHKSISEAIYRNAKEPVLILK